jgi:hypothetical protein
VVQVRYSEVVMPRVLAALVEQHAEGAASTMKRLRLGGNAYNYNNPQERI